MRGARLVALAALLCAGCEGAFLGPAPSTDNAAIFDQVWREVDLHYSFFEYKDVNWDSLGAFYRPRAVEARSPQELALVVGRMLRELRDVHVSLTPFGSGSTIRYLSPFDTTAMFYRPDLVFQRYVQRSAVGTTPHLSYGMAAGTVGYIRIPSFEGTTWANEIDEAIGNLRGASSLIIDLRNNYGGNIALAISIAGRFTAVARPYGYVRLRDGPAHDKFTKPIEESVKPAGSRKFLGRVFVLVNRRNFSSAEDFVLAMRTMPNVRIVGDTTAGASGGPIVRELPNGWTFQLSAWIEFTREEKMFEGVGLPPDVFVRAVGGDPGTDVPLERALLLALSR